MPKRKWPAEAKWKNISSRLDYKQNGRCVGQNANSGALLCMNFLGTDDMNAVTSSTKKKPDLKIGFLFPSLSLSLSLSLSA